MISYSFGMNDSDLKKDSLLISMSKFISNFFNPITSLLIYFVYFSYKNFSFAEASKQFLPILLILILPITLWIVWNVQKGYYSNMDVSNRRQRNSLYIFIAAMMIVYLIVSYLLFDKVDYMILFLFLLLLLMQVSNFFIKSSMHTALNVFAAALFFSIEPLAGLLWLGIAILVGITRIILKRHTVKEVLMGAFLALFVSSIFLYVHLQNQAKLLYEN